MQQEPTPRRARFWRRPTRRGGILASITATMALALTVAGVALAPSASAAEIGPNPTQASLEASRGPFATSSTNVSALSVSGFGGGVIYYPTDTSLGRLGAVAISPGFISSWSNISWLGPRIASHGFVVIGIDTLSRFDQPASRGAQLLAALDYLTNSSSVRTRVDASRLAVSGHSMGGGGSLAAISTRPSLRAAIPIAPWHSDKTWSEVTVPTAIVGGENDTIASMSAHSTPFYNSLGSTEKALLELNDASHLFPLFENDPLAVLMVSWLKRFVDGDTRYNQFICPGPSGAAVQNYRSTCPV